MAGCPLSCLNACTCTCNTSGPVWAALSADVVSYCDQNEICHDPILQKAMNFAASEFECDSALAIALKGLYQLCGTTHGLCRHGACTDEDCISNVLPACMQNEGITEDTSYLIAMYAMVVMLLYLWGRSSLAMLEDGGVLKPPDNPPPSYTPKPSSTSILGKVYQFM